MITTFEQRTRNFRPAPPVPATRDAATELLRFCQRRGGDKCFVAWPPATLWQYLCFHAAQDTLYVVRDGGDAVQTPGTPAGVCVAWRDKQALLDRRILLGHPTFQWQPDNARGDCLVIGEVLADGPDAMRALARAVAARHADHPDQPVFTHRRAVWQRLPRATWERLVNGGAR